MPINLVMNALSFMVNVFAGLWLVPYLVNEIGITAYGLVPLAMVFTEYVGLITVSISGAVTRFLTIDIQNNQWKEANRTFNTAFFALLVLVCVQLPVLSLITYNVDLLINVPKELLQDTYYLFTFTFLGYLISLFSGVFGISTYAHNRLDLSRLADISKILVRILAIVLLFILIRPSLMFVGIANLAGALVSVAISGVNWRRLTPKLKINISSFDKRRLKDITSMGGWLIVNMVGYLLFLKIDILVINRFLGTMEGGQYAAILQWNSLIRTVAGVLSGVVGPMILISFATKKINQVIKYGTISVKFLSISIGILAGLISGFSQDLLTLWLGEDFGEFSILLVIMLCHLSINLGILPLLSINTAMNKVRIPGILSLVMGGVNLILAIVFVKLFQWGFYGVAIAGGIALTLKNGLFTPWYAAKILGIKKTTFFAPLFHGNVLYVLSLIISFGLHYYFSIDNWLHLIYYATLASLIMVSIMWIFILSREDKKVLLDFLPASIKKKVHKNS